MIRLPQVLLDPAAAAGLAAFQTEVDQAAGYELRVSEAKRLFSLRNKPSNSVFSEVRRKLTEMCSGAMRCAYCEDSARDQVEHIAPKDWYPERVFVWENYVYACGPCNRRKSNKFALFSQTSGQRIDLTRSRNDPVVPPEPGDPLLLNPRAEDPSTWLMLDLAGTFYFVPSAARGTREYERAEYTIDLLGLNGRDELPVARAGAYGNYRARLREYIQRKGAGAAQPELGRLRQGLIQSNHPTVWREMVRQQGSIPELRGLFAQAPEALGWQ